MIGPFLCVLLALAADGTELPRERVLADGPVLNVSGTVLDHTGEPVANAEVTLRIKGSGISIVSLRKHNILAQTTTDAQGKFRFDNIGIPPRHEEVMEQLHLGRGGVIAIVRAPKKALAWLDVDSYAPKLLPVTLSPAADVSGTLLDEQDRPLAGAEVRLLAATPRRTNIDGTFNKAGDLNLFTSSLPLETKSDEEGRFRMPYIPVGMRVMLEATAKGRTPRIFMVDTGDDATLTEAQFEESRDERRPLLRSPLKLSLLPQTAITVRVVDHEGKPVSGGTVQAIRENHTLAAFGDLTAQGEVQIPIKTAEKLRFHFDAGPGAPYLNTTATIDADPQQVAKPIVLKLPKPRWLTGRVVDAEGQGVSGVYVYYANQASADTGPSGSSFAVSHDDGNFRIPVVPGRGTLRIAQPVYRFFTPPREVAAKLAIPVDIAETGELAPVTVRIHRGLVLEGVVHNAEQQPVAGIKVHARVMDDSYRQLTVTTNARGRYRFTGVSPLAKAVVSVADQAGCALVQLPGDAEHDLTTEKRVTQDLSLKPGVTLVGRVVQDGKPQSGVRIRLAHSRPSDENRFYLSEAVTTDTDGEFRLYGLAEGDRYHLELDAGEDRGALGWRHQAPYMNVVGKEPEIRLTDAELVTFRQRLSGIVVDPSGNPVAGITVSAQLESREQLSLRYGRPQPWIESQKDGQFELTGLPDVPLQLMAYKRNPAGGRIRFPSVVSTKLNQADIRIVIDPELDQETESLDEPMPK